MIQNRSFETVREEEMLEWLKTPFAEKKSNIREIMAKWTATVPENQLFVALYDEIKDEPAHLIKRTYSFLGLDTDFLPEKHFYQRKINTLTKPNYEIPKNVQDYIDERFGPETEYVTQHYPELAKYWSTA